jgi:hypothetical protein
VLPFERLRYLARHAGDDRALVLEAADCLADFSYDPTQLVTVCRRLLAHHARCGPLWWLCARVITAPDPAEGAREASRLIESDRTARRLGSLLPFPHDEPIAVVGWPEVVGDAVADRPDLDLVAIRTRDGATHRQARRFRDDRAVRVVDETDAMALAPSHLLVEVHAMSPAEAVVPAGVTDLLWGLGEAKLWLVAGVGRVLPGRLFDVLRRQVEIGNADVGGDPDVEVLEVSRAERIAGAAGLDPPERMAQRIDCPVAPELLRI